MSNAVMLILVLKDSLGTYFYHASIAMLAWSWES